MESACPNCKTKLEHEDYLFEVVCLNCKTRYNPFYEKFDGGEVEEVPAVSADFQESTNAFKEIVQFGEELGNVDAPSDSVAPPMVDDLLASPEPESVGVSASSAPKPRPVSAPVVATDGSNVLMTSGDMFSGYRITTYLPPHSVWTDANGDSDNPLEGAFMVLWEKCQQKGANAIIAIQWRFTPDGNRILVSGTPVQCEKE